MASSPSGGANLSIAVLFLCNLGLVRFFEGDDVFVPDAFTVIWSKEKEGGVDVIYVGHELMGTDSRFVLDNLTRNVWNLTIRNVVPFDEGTYLCQITTKDKPMVQRQRLSVKSESISFLSYLKKNKRM